MDLLGPAFLFVAMGIFFILIALLMVLVMKHNHAVPQVATAAFKDEDQLSDHHDAILVVESGGRVRRMNQRARQIFRVGEGEQPKLEMLCRKARPSDALLKLCTTEAQTRFVLDGRLVEATSYLVSSNGLTNAVVSLRYPEIGAGLNGGQNGASAQSLQTFTQLARNMAASLDLDETLQAVMESMEKLIPADFMEIAIWDAESEQFVPYRFNGLAGVERKMEQVSDRYAVDHGFTGLLYRSRKPLLVKNLSAGEAQASEDLRRAAAQAAMPLHSYLGMPLLVGSELIGTIELGSMTADAFREEDLELAQLLAGQAAVAVHNALLYRKEQQRTAELSGLAQMTQAFGSVRDPNGVYARLIESIVPLIPVDIIGFLIYNENQRVLEACKPFHGLPDPIVELYKTEVHSGSLAEKALIEQDVLLTEDASADEKWTQLGLDHLAKAASLRETALVPLATGGHMLGFLQASNHTGGPMPFTQPELHLLMIVANQTASIIENVALIHQSRQRAQRAEALRRITSLASSAANLDEILLFSIQELARLLRADAGAIFLLEQESGELKMHRPSLFGSLPELPERMTRLLIEDPQFHFTVVGSQHALTLGSAQDAVGNASGKAIVPFYQAILSQWGAESLVAVPLIVRDQGIGEVWFASRSRDFFDHGDVQVVATAAGQLAGVVEQSTLRSQTDESLRRRVEQMTAITRISRELSTSLDLNYLLNLVYDEALRTTRADCGTILLFNLNETGPGEQPTVRFYVGDMPESERTPLERWVIETDLPMNVADFARSEFQPPHPGIQSTLVAPISHQGQDAGLICLHGRQVGQFDETAVEITQSLAVQAAVALNNALAYEEQTRHAVLLKRELETLSRLVQVARVLRPSQSLQQSMSSIAQAIQSATPFQSVVISIYDPETEMLRRVAGCGLSPELWEELRSHSQPWSGLQQLMQPEYRVGEAYYIPDDRRPAIPEEVHVVSVLPSLNNELEDAWHTHDMLIIPLHDSDGRPLGMISVDAPSDHRRPDRPTYEALEVFAAQAAIVVESHQRASRLRVQLDELERERVRLEGAAVQAQGNLPLMLHKEMEQSITLRGLNQRIERLRASLEIATLATRQESEDAVLHTLASQMLTRFSMQAALVAENGPSGIRLVEAIGAFPPNTNPEALFGQRNPLRQMMLNEKGRDAGRASGRNAARLSEGGLLLVSNIENDAEWKSCTMLNVLEARSMIGLHLDLGNGREAGVLLLGQRALPAFLEEDRQVFAQIAYQTSVGIKNLQLLNETRRRLHEVDLLLDFSRKLGSLEPADILSALVENVAQVLPVAHSGWVGMWEEKQLAIVPQAAVGYASEKDILGIRYALQTASGGVNDSRVVLPLRVYRTGRAERISEVDFAAQYHLSADDLLRYRKATSGRLPISAMVIPLRIGESVLGVVFFENFDTPGAFSEEDEALAFSFTRQAAMALENARLYQASEQRAAQLQALTMVANTITSSLQRDELISFLLDRLKLVLPYDTATLWLRNENTLTVAAATGFADNDLRLNLSVEVEDSQTFRTMIQTGEPISVGDLRNDPRFPMLVEPDHLSWLGIPLIYKSQVIGLIALEKHESDFYQPVSIAAGVAFASQAAVSLENARLYEESTRRAAELDERSNRLALLNQLSSELAASLDIDYISQLTGQQLRSALGADGVAALMIELQGNIVLQAEVPACGAVLPVELPAVPLFDHLRESHGIFQTSSAFSESALQPLVDPFLKPRSAMSLLFVPLMAGPAMQGWFLVYSTAERRYTLPEIELARTICNQAAIAVQNARLFAETNRLTEDLERRVEERTNELRREHQNSQTLLHIISELSSSLDMGLVLSRTLSVLNESVGSEESLIILSQGHASQYRAGQTLARAPQSTEPGVAVERQIAKWVIRSRKPVLVHQAQIDSRWEVHPEGAPLYQSVAAVPLVMGEEVLGALLLLHRETGFFAEAQLNLLEATARQIGIALNNAELFNLIRDQSEHLGGMLREQQIEASRSRAILEAVADGVLVTDAQNRITLFNASAERILNLRSSQVMGKSLDHFSGLFGMPASEWMGTIRSWSENPGQSMKGEDGEAPTYAEQVSLDNGRIVAVHLAPVFWRHDFLGTVSSFRDITHEVQVDRLKSEFVANVSHELRTPLTSIKGYVEIMLMGASGELSPQQAHFMKIVKSNTERLSVLVNDLLDISRIEAGRVSLNFQALDMREIAEEVIADLQRRSREENRPMNFVLDSQPGLPFALGDTERVRQVLSSLVCNGYLYTPENGCVTIHISEKEKEIQVDVEDNGIGIAPDVRHRIFERFYRGEDPLVLASAGTGLGLAISKTLVEMHNGRIWFESSGERGEGSVFSFTLPVHES